LYKIDEIVVYIGGLYEQYGQQKCIIMNRIKSHGKEYYYVQFEDHQEYIVTACALRTD
jgi:hypothetical protein